MSNISRLEQPKAIDALMEIAAMVRSGDVVGVTVVLTSKAGDVQTVRITSPIEIKASLVA